MVATELQRHREIEKIHRLVIDSGGGIVLASLMRAAPSASVRCRLAVLACAAAPDEWTNGRHLPVPWST